MSNQHALSDNFAYFFKRLNPSPTFEQIASSEHRSIVGLLENPNGPAAALSPQCFLQGSYKQGTSIYTINDVDIVALCRLWQPGTPGGGKGWSRDDIFATLAAPLLNDGRYRDKVRYNNQSMCIKVDLGIKIEILPVVYKQGNNDFSGEPFRLYRPQKGEWDDGFARQHQALLTNKNKSTGGNFKPMTKVMKHLRSRFTKAVSFHIECLLYSFPDSLYAGNPSTYISTVLQYISSQTDAQWHSMDIKTPCGERRLFTDTEWDWKNWMEFHSVMVKVAEVASIANQTTDRNLAIQAWQAILGKEFFPAQVSV